MRKRAGAEKGETEESSDQSVELNQLAERPREWLRILEREASEHPLRTAGLAVGAGFVLGGGLLTPLMARLFGVGLRLALRVAIVPALSRGLGELGGQLMEGSLGFGTATNTEGTRS
jgi:hypothetical protein